MFARTVTPIKVGFKTNTFSEQEFKIEMTYRLEILNKNEGNRIYIVCIEVVSDTEAKYY